MAFEILRVGSVGKEVERWQQFLIGEHIDTELTADGRFGPHTEEATKKYQSLRGLKPDGIVGPKTLGLAIADGMAVVEDKTDMSKTGLNFPPRPAFQPLLSTSQRQAVFGAFSFKPKPVPGNPENIDILGSWEKDNLVDVNLPALKGVDTFGTPNRGHMMFHAKAKPQLESVWAAWAQQGLADRVLSFGGSFVPRFIRGSRITLSNHAFGSAFDINTSENPLGKTPALVGTKGSVRELVPIANDFGFFWGGHFRNRPDGMHFEIAEILSDSQLATARKRYGI